MMDLSDVKTDGKIQTGSRLGGHETCGTTGNQKFSLENHYAKVDNICRATYKVMTEVLIKYRGNSLDKNTEFYVLS